MRHARTDVEAFERAVVELSEVQSTYHVAGSYDHILQVEVADVPAYERFHAHRLANLPSVAALNSYVTRKILDPVARRTPTCRRSSGVASHEPDDLVHDGRGRPDLGVAGGQRQLAVTGLRQDDAPARDAR